MAHNHRHNLIDTHTVNGSSFGTCRATLSSVFICSPFSAQNGWVCTSCTYLNIRVYIRTFKHIQIYRHTPSNKHGFSRAKPSVSVSLSTYSMLCVLSMCVSHSESVWIRKRQGEREGVNEGGSEGNKGQMGIQFPQNAHPGWRTHSFVWWTKKNELNSTEQHVEQT